MFKCEKLTDQIIQKLYRNNSLEGENEMEYWNRLWQKSIDYYKEKGIPEEIESLWWKYLYDEMLEHYIELLGTINNKTICELGCGSGYSSIMMATKGAKVTLVDYAPLSSVYSKHICQYMNIDTDKINFITDDAFSKDLDIGQFDVVWNCGVIEHYKWDEAVELIKIMAKHATKGGKVMVTLPNLLSPEFIYLTVTVGKGSEKYYSYRMLKKIMQEAGLSNVKVQAINYWLPSNMSASFSNKLREVKFFRHFKGLCWLFTGIGEKQ
ncbi:class I SAM-dependent methyltransferase [Ruminiclostridium cellulolyticum]|uniref:Methyltransferase type 12 n=1 Tax=Ruminiclostridium cellulolyticum (strain ATCC 35319 / DSM 5812 / JCM 6584 / H10) TaxID=394503 RepID=B8I9F2_RUMCH|nr:class I SAM-dependent methyltransferase [Ruminiclostridium cellulolyticum]ACL75412.1 Methyltransferase type 12 [Ruminiclostridium cellulolyticum H10]